MRTRNKVLVGGVIGMALMSFICSTYFFCHSNSSVISRSNTYSLN